MTVVIFFDSDINYLVACAQIDEVIFITSKWRARPSTVLIGRRIRVARSITMLEYFGALHDVGAVQFRKYRSRRTIRTKREAQEPLEQQKRQSRLASLEIIPHSEGNAGETEITICGSFNEDLIRNVRAIAILEDVTVEFLVGEALDLLLRSRGLYRSAKIA